MVIFITPEGHVHMDTHPHVIYQHNIGSSNLRRNFDSNVSDNAVVGFVSFFKQVAHSRASNVFVRCSPQPGRRTEHRSV